MHMHERSLLLSQAKGLKILVTIGPSSASADVIEEMIKHGVRGFRINMSFGDKNTWDSYSKIIREKATDLDSVVAIIGDIPGPQVRTALSESLEVKKGQIIVLTTSASNLETSELKIPITQREVFAVMENGDTVLYGDGEIELRVVDVGEDYAKCIVKTPGILKPGRKIIIPGKELPIPFLSDREVELLKYICINKFTYVALSYVRNEQDVLLARGLLDRDGCGDIGIISKIETHSGVKNAEKIAKVSDAVLIARGDLGAHFPIETIPLIQERIVKVSVELGKPVIFATDILDSMIEGVRPSRSDVVGFYNIVHSLADAVLLTNETAIGKYPVEAVKWAYKIALTAFENTPREYIEQFRKRIKPSTLLEKYVHGLVSLAESLNASILAYTKTGRIAPLISRERPRVPVYVGSWNKRLLEKYSIYYGIQTIDLSLTLGEHDDYEKGVRELYLKARSKGYLKPGDIIVESYAKPGLNVHEIRVEVVL